MYKIRNLYLLSCCFCLCKKQWDAGWSYPPPTRIDSYPTTTPVLRTWFHIAPVEISLPHGAATVQRLKISESYIYMVSWNKRSKFLKHMNTTWFTVSKHIVGVYGYRTEVADSGPPYLQLCYHIVRYCHIASYCQIVLYCHAAIF